MTVQPRHIDQHYWRHDQAGHVEIRRTYNSTIGYKAHSHQQLSLGIIESGSTQLTCGDQILTLQTSEMILIPPHLVHACNPIGNGPRSYHMIYINADWCLESLSHIYGQPVGPLSTTPVIIQNPNLTQAYITIAEDLDNNLAKLDALLFQILGTYCDLRSPNAEDDTSRNVKEALLHDLATPPTLDDLALKLRITPETIIRRFKKAYGITPKAFLNNARIEKAKILLRNDIAIVDAALDVGYADQSQFHKAFVTFCAATPKQYQDIKG